MIALLGVDMTEEEAGPLMQTQKKECPHGWRLHEKSLIREFWLLLNEGRSCILECDNIHNMI